MLRTALLGLLIALLPLSATAQTRLLMAEEPGCMWCARWNAEIGPIYAKTQEGQTAPLQRYDIRAGTPDGVALRSGVVFTPTFILVQNGVEVGRIEGYPGEDFFWGLLGQVFSQAAISMDQSG